MIFVVAIVGYAFYSNFQCNAALKREEALRVSLVRELEARLPRGSPKEKIGAAFEALKLHGSTDDTLLPYYTAEVPVENQWLLFEKHTILLMVWVDSSRSSERVEGKISTRTF